MTYADIPDTKELQPWLKIMSKFFAKLYILTQYWLQILLTDIADKKFFIYPNFYSIMKWELTAGNDLTSPLIPPVTSP